MSITFRFIALPDSTPQTYRKTFSDAVTFNHAGQLLLQRRPQGWDSSGGKLTLFGGHVENGETPLQAICRELHEELGARATPESISALGIIEEHCGDAIDAVYIHLWHDRDNSITGCYESSSEAFASITDALNETTLMDYARLALQQAQKKT